MVQWNKILLYGGLGLAVLWFFGKKKVSGYSPSLGMTQAEYNTATKPPIDRTVPEIQTYSYEGKTVRSSSPEIVRWAGGSRPQIIPIKESSRSTVVEAANQFVRKKLTRSQENLAVAIHKKFAR